MSCKSNTVDIDIFSGLVSMVYDAAVDATLWPVFVQRLAQSLNACSGLLRVQDLSSKEVGMYVTHGLDPAFKKKYKEHYVHIDPLMPRFMDYPAGTSLQTATILSPSFKKTEFYNDYSHPQGLDQALGCILQRNASQLAILGIHRPDEAGCYKPHELALVDLLVPHLQRAFHINRCLFQLSDKASSTCDALNHLSVGIILIDTLGRPVFFNAKAETMIAANCGLVIKVQSVQSTTWDDTQALQKLIFSASQSPQKEGGALTIFNSSISSPLNILAMPITKDSKFEIGIDLSHVTVALFMSNQGAKYDFSLDVLRALYGLTQAEARLAAALANGHNLEYVSNKYHVSKNTVRSQLKSCFRKTGAKQQAELVKLIISGPAVYEKNAF